MGGRFWALLLTGGALAVGAPLQFQGQVEPFQRWTLRSDVAGKVVEVNLSAEGRKGEGVILQLDRRDEEIKLQNLLRQRDLLRRKLQLQREVVARKLELYNRIKDLKSKSKLEKEQRFFDYSGAETTLLNLQQQLAETEANIALLRRTIEKKLFRTPFYIEKIYPRVGEFIGVGAPVADLADLSREKIVLFVPVEVASKLKGAQVVVAGRRGLFKISKIWKVPDRHYVTSYRVELIGKGLPVGEVVPVQFELPNQSKKEGDEKED